MPFIGELFSDKQTAGKRVRKSKKTTGVDSFSW